MKHVRTFRFVGWLGLVLTTFAAIFWWGWAMPIVRGSVPAWDPQFSAEGFWEAKQAALRAGFWMHDDGWIAGHFGDKAWAELIIRKISEGAPYYGCENGHQDTALELLTNHFPKETKKEELEKAWLAWWQENSSKTQEEWIRDGFAEAGFAISLPPSRNDWPVLLRIIGASAGPNARPSGRPQPLYGNLRYNAYRWLRDSGFDPVAFLLETDASTLDGDMRGGLTDYVSFDGSARLAFPAGRLAFANRPDDEYFTGLRGPILDLARPRSLDAVGATICGVALAGAFLVLFLAKQRRAATAVAA